MSLDGAYDPQNLFAKILRGELPCHRITEDEHTLAFMDLFPQSRGHCLVLPKAPARNLLELQEEALAPLMRQVKRVAHGVTSALRPDGVVITQFNGAPAGQTVFHIHVHVIPRYTGEEFAGHGLAQKADDAALADLADRISASLPDLSST